MSRSLLSSEEVKKILNVRDFFSIPKDKLIEFVSTIPNMDKDVAIKIIEQFPAFGEFAQTMVAHYSSMCNNILQENEGSTEATLEAYQRTLDVLGELSLKEDISANERHFFATKMVEVTDKMAAFDSRNKSFVAEIHKYETYVVLAGIFLGSILLGVNLKCVKIPRLK